MAAITSSQITSLLYPGLNDLLLELDTYPNQYKQIYKTRKTNQVTVYDLEMQSFGLPGLMEEGAPAPETYYQQSPNRTAYVIKTYGMSTAITANAIEDNLYKDQFPQIKQQIKASFDTNDNILAMNPINNAFSGANGTMAADGQPLCSTAHPIANGQTYSNTFPNGVSFNLAALQEAIVAIKSFTNYVGHPINVNPEALLGSQNMVFSFSVIRNSKMDPTTTNNAINPINYDNWLPKGAIINNFIKNPNAWFVLTDAELGFTHYVKGPDTHVIDYMTDTQTDNVIIKAKKRQVFGYTNPKCIFGSRGPI